jgi:hypothetical protein
MDADEVPMSFEKGLSIVTVVRFLEFVKNQATENANFFSMMPGSGSLLDIFMWNNYGKSPIQMCIGIQEAFYSFCTTAK